MTATELNTNSGMGGELAVGSLLAGGWRVYWQCQDKSGVISQDESAESLGLGLCGFSTSRIRVCELMI
jgi:hypothetical protein